MALFTAHKTSLVFSAKDLARTEAFYRDFLGVAFERRGEGREMFLFARLSEDFDISFMVGEPRPGNSPLVVFSLPEGGIADVVAGLAEKGVTIISPVGEAPMGKGASFRDPDGYALGLYQGNDKPVSLKGDGQ